MGRLIGDGRGWCYAGMVLGGSISVYANVAEKFVRYDEVAHRWLDNPDPALDGILLAAAAPVAVWLMLEILIQVKGRDLRAWAARLSAALVALVAFSTSFQHLHGLLLARGESALTAWSYPLGIDGLMVGAAAVLWQIRARPTSAHEAAQRPNPAQRPTAQSGPVAQGRPTAQSGPVAQGRPTAQSAHSGPAQEAAQAGPAQLAQGQPAAQGQKAQRPEAAPVVGQRQAAQRPSGRPKADRPRPEAVAQALAEGELGRLTRKAVQEHYGITSNGTADTLIRETKDHLAKAQATT